MGRKKICAFISWRVHKHTTNCQWNVFILANYLPGSGRPPSKVNNSQHGKKKGGKSKKKQLEEILNGQWTKQNVLLMEPPTV